jgi:hypothetical protein
MKTYAGPLSDHFDGSHFFDPDGAPPKKLSEVLRWQFGSGRKRQAWPEWAPSPHADTPPPRVTGDKVRLSFVGHASWLIQAAGLNILIDPVWSARASPLGWAGPKRHNDPGIAFDALPRIDIVLVSHGHYDHLDVATLSKLAAKFSARVITPLGNDVTMRSADDAIRTEVFDWHDRVELGSRIAVTLVGARIVRPQQGAVGEFCAGDAGRENLHRLRFRLWRGQTFPSRCRSAWPIAAGDPPDRRL